jgi:hypothetical protein
MAWRCFVVEETGEAVLSLRRCAGDDAQCPTGWGYHHATVVVGRAPVTYQHRDDRVYYAKVEVEPWAIDYRWPTKCDHCDYVFSPGKPHASVDWPNTGDRWYVDQEPIFRRTDGTPGEWTQASLPIGAMWDSKWTGWRGADGFSWTVKLPPGGKHDWWCIDGPATNGGGWERSGVAPDLVVTPSIDAGGQYHGFLGSNTAPAPGWLSDPL